MASSSSDIGRLRKISSRRKRRYLAVQNLLINIKSFDQIFVLAVAIIIGISAGYLSIAFRLLIENLQLLLWGPGQLTGRVIAAPLYLKMGIPAVVGMIVAVSVNKFAAEAKGHGVPEVMDAVARKNGFIRARVVIIKALASAMSIASGAAVGREGPIIHMGSAFGSLMGQLFQVSRLRMNTFVACGAAAGIAATFNAPVAGAIFASEVILTDFSIAAVSPIIMASVFGTIVSRSVDGNFSAFTPPEFLLKSSSEIGFYIVLGLVIGLAGWAFVRLLYLSEDKFDELRIPVAIKALIGGVSIGAIAIYYPQIMGVGYDSMEAVFQGEITIMVAASLALLKMIATSLSLGSGASGGVFAPSLFIGSMVGMAMGGVFHSLFPAITAPSGAYSLVGMAAMVAATTHAPITAFMIIFEMTGEYSIILPLMVTSITASLVTTRMLDGSIYTLKLKRRGVDIRSGADVNILDKLQVSKIKQQIVERVEENLPLSSLLERLTASNQPYIYVVDKDEILVGLVSQGIVSRFLNEVDEIPSGMTARDICNTHLPEVTDDTAVHTAFTLMMEMDMYALPITDAQGRLDGQVLRSRVFSEYQDMLIKTQLAGHVAAKMKFGSSSVQERTEVLPGFQIARIDVPSQFLNQTVYSLDMRNRYQIEILIVRKKTGDEYVEAIPSKKLVMERGDQILVFGEADYVDKVCQLR